MIRGKKPLRLWSQPTDKEIKKRGRNLGKQEEWPGEGVREAVAAPLQRRCSEDAEDCHTGGCVDKGCMQKWIITRA